jgi:hypothetical protein
MDGPKRTAITPVQAEAVYVALPADQRTIKGLAAALKAKYPGERIPSVPTLGRWCQKGKWHLEAEPTGKTTEKKGASKVSQRSKTQQDQEPTAPSNNGNITATGKFAPGNRLGKGRPKGARNKATMAVQKLLDGEAETLTRKAIELAKDGNMAALRLCIERLLPPQKDRPVTLDLPPMDSVKDLSEALGALTMAMAAGEITLSEAEKVAAVLELRRRAIETTEIEERLAALEGYRDEQARQSR